MAMKILHCHIARVAVVQGMLSAHLRLPHTPGPLHHLPYLPSLESICVSGSSLKRLWNRIRSGRVGFGFMWLQSLCSSSLECCRKPCESTCHDCMGSILTALHDPKSGPPQPVTPQLPFSSSGSPTCPALRFSHTHC